MGISTIGESVRVSLRGLVLLVLSALIVLPTEPALAKPKFAALAIDARTGEVLFARDADGPRHPASLTKVMTLYLLFQDLKAKRLTLKSKLRVSRFAAAQSPSKLGVKAGQTVTVETAIKALVTRSANDIAVVIAENLGGSESAFAARMTKTARAIGMKRSTFKNASGLPHPAQWTTARDMATLSLRIQRDFPQYYPYFRISAFTYNGRVIRTHNKLLGRYAGTDGIKTGYIRASGFNLTTSARRGAKRVVGVVLGSQSPVARNRYMMTMLDQAFPKCQDGTAIALAVGNQGPAPAAVEPIPQMPKKRRVFAGRQSDLQDSPNPLPSVAPTTETAAIPSVTPALDEAPEPTSGSAFEVVTVEDENAAPPSLPESLPFEVKSKTAPALAAADPAPAHKPNWNIQIGAFPSKADADIRLESARQSAAPILAGKPSFTMAVNKGAATVYRARFSGLSQANAKAACKRLTAKGIGCMTLAPQS